MNYALMVSMRIEEKLEKVHRVGNWTQDDEDEAYKECLQEVLEEDEGRTLAAGNTRMGDYILLSGFFWLFFECCLELNVSLCS